MPKVFVSGALGNKPFNGGNAWSRLSWVAGFQRLGFEVIFVEEIKSAACRDETGRPTTVRNSVNLRYFRSVLERFGLSRSSALLCDEGQEVYGLSLDQLTASAREAVFLFNLSGHLTHEGLRSCFRSQIYYDDDPGFTQFWHASGTAGARLAGHDFFFTIGANIGQSDCVIPTGGIEWRPTRPPVVLEQWPVCDATSFKGFTTVASWRGPYGPVEYQGRRYGLKVHEFRRFVSLPRQVSCPFEVALQIDIADEKDLETLRSSGWLINDPRLVAGSPERFREYLQQSGAEFSVAQEIYVATNSGWFSDRTVKYLACGRPALVQETGFSQSVPVGKGLLSFRTMEEAIDGAERIQRDYPEHCRAARQLAEECFDSEKVIQQLLAALNVRGPRQRGGNRGQSKVPAPRRTSRSESRRMPRWMAPAADLSQPQPAATAVGGAF